MKIHCEMSTDSSLPKRLNGVNVYLDVISFNHCRQWKVKPRLVLLLIYIPVIPTVITISYPTSDCVLMLVMTLDQHLWES